MAKKNRPSGTTAPKGKPTPRRSEHGRGGMSAGLQWFLLVIIGIVVLFVLFRLFNTDGGDPGALAGLALLPLGPVAFGDKRPTNSRQGGSPS